MTEKRYLTLPRPAEGEDLGDLERLTAGLHDEFGTIEVSYRVMCTVSELIRAADYRVTASLVRTHAGWALVGVQAGDTTGRHYGFACDLGSTTIAVQLVDVNTGAIIDTHTAVNAQVKLGTDILTRIFYTHEPDAETARLRRDELRMLAVDTIQGLMDELLLEHGITERDCPLLIVAGNTTMTHFLLGIDAFCVFSAPFAPAFNSVPTFAASEVGFRYGGMLHCFASAANYLGGDITSGLWATGLPDADELSLFIDIGTNGEMAIGSREFLIAGAGAAGPALEGGISKSGMRAAPGAVDTVRIEDGSLTVTTIGNERPLGICGSGIVDLLAQLLLAGWMEPSGRLVPERSDRIRTVVRENGAEEPAVVYADETESATGEPLMFTESDILQFTDTKSAAHTMVACLLEASGVSAADVKHIYLAGAFGEHLDLESAITIGLYPDLPREVFVSAGNTSLWGARKLLLDESGLECERKILETVYYLQFATQPNFLELMQAAKFYPHTDMRLYPNVARRLAGQ